MGAPRVLFGARAPFWGWLGFVVLAAAVAAFH